MNKSWKLEEIKIGKSLKREREQKTETSILINLKAPLSNLLTAAVNITSNVEQPPGEKRIEAEKRDSNRKSYVQVLLNTSTAKEKIADTDSQISSLAIDDRNATDNRYQRKTKKLAKSSIAKTSIGKNASVDF